MGLVEWGTGMYNSLVSRKHVIDLILFLLSYVARWQVHLSVLLSEYLWIILINLKAKLIIYKYNLLTC